MKRGTQRLQNGVVVFLIDRVAYQYLFLANLALSRAFNVEQPLEVFS